MSIIDSVHRHTWVHFVFLLGCVALALFLEWPTSTTEREWNWSCVYKLAWVFPLPYTVLTFLGLLVPERKHQANALDPEHARTLHVCTVTKGANLEAVQRVQKEMAYLTKQPNIRWTILTDENEFTDNLRKVIIPGVHLCVTPKSFVTKTAKYKSRALEYFRQHIQLKDLDFVLHMDEESILDQETLGSCLQFVHKNNFPIGQGVILYNSHNYFKNWLLTVLDAIRVTDDLGRYRFQYNWAHVPFVGFHGSFLLIRGDVENKITWDHDNSANLTEDFAFAMKCWELGYRCGAIGGVVREVSPNNLFDFVKQRRRWFIGILTLPYWTAKCWALLWMLGVLTISATYFHLLFSIFYFYPTPIWISAVSAFSFVVSIFVYAYGILIQSLDWCRLQQMSVWQTVAKTGWHLVLGTICFPFCPLVESFCIVYSLLCRPKQFDVINKA